MTIPTFNTTGMKNVEDAFTKAGGAGTHIPGAATGIGATTNTSKDSPSTTGMGTDEHQKKFGDQYNQPGVLGKVVSKAFSGSETGTNGMNSAMG